MGLSASIAMRWGGLVTYQAMFMFLQTYRFLPVRSVFVFVYSFSHPLPFTDIFLLFDRTTALGHLYGNWQDVYMLLLYLILARSYFKTDLSGICRYSH